MTLVGSLRRVALVSGLLAVLGMAAIVVLLATGRVFGLFWWLFGGWLLVESVLLLVAARQRDRYVDLEAVVPGAGLRPTDERFVDPESENLVQVWQDPATGARQYRTVGVRIVGRATRAPSGAETEKRG